MAASSKEICFGRWKVVVSHAIAYSANEPDGVFISWNAATRSPVRNSVTSSPTSSTIPAISSPEFVPLSCDTNFGSLQSLRLVPDTITLINHLVSCRLWHRHVLEADDNTLVVITVGSCFLHADKGLFFPSIGTNLMLRQKSKSQGSSQDRGTLLRRLDVEG